MDLPERLMSLVDATNMYEVSGGHQSRVFEATRSADGQRVVVKVLDDSLVNRDDVVTRVEVVAELAQLEPRVCRPLPLDGSLVTVLDGDGDWVGLACCFEYAEGSALIAARPGDAELMGQTLAHLHLSMRSIEPKDLPLVAALRTAPFHSAGPIQLLHGDFNAGNLRHADGAIRIFDFDDCGYGPPLFDVANALYMALFDDRTNGTTSYYRSFDDAFVSGYSAVSGHVLDRDELKGFIDLRVAALESWLDDLTTAPTGIRMATQQWHATLRSFIGSYHDQLA